MRKDKITHKLFYRVFTYFAGLVLIFAGLMSIIFMKSYENDKDSYYDTFLKEQVSIIAERMQQYVHSSDLDSYMAYMEMLEDTINADVWIFSNKNATQPMDRKLENINISDKEMSKDSRYVRSQAFLGKIVSREGFSLIRDENVIIIGAPIYEDDISQDVIGAVLLLAPVEAKDENTENIRVMFAFSVLIAFLVAFVLAGVFAKRLCGPITQIRKVTKEIADGNYNMHTGIREHNEIGDLAFSVDVLAGKLKENEEERASIEQMRKDFFSNISHELRTPITVIRAYLESLMDGVVSEEKVPKYYGRMLGECTGMQRLIEDLLLLSKMENPQFSISLEPVNVVQVFEDVIRNFRVICNKKKIRMEIDSDTECCFISGDYDRIRQVFLAILDNALKFSHKESTIYIKIRTLDTIIVSIRDEGRGIEQQALQHIFDKFYTQKSDCNQNGSGLGLVIAKEVVKKHNGTIEVKSELGVGTEFILTFPQIKIAECYE